MPAIPKSPSTKRAGAPKAKGAVRAKSGCYTCRIRRKKCDEQPDSAGQCQTCVRLRLECLGFGAKRPEWLRESRNVDDIREKIKGFLAAQGMIKGHSGSGPRTAEHEPPTLRLAEEYSSSSESPPTQTLSLSSDSIRRHHHTSSIRDEAWTLIDNSYNQSGLYPSSLRESPPYDDGTQTSYHLNSPTSIVPSPAIASSFSSLYNQPIVVDYEHVYINPPDFVELLQNPSNPYVQQTVDQLVRHYMREVVGIQYILADKALRRIIFETLSTNERTRDAVKLLASVHYNRFRAPTQAALENDDTRSRMSSLSPLLNQKDFSAEDAMAALHVVSSILFDGGQGAWDQWLTVARTFVNDVFGQYLGPVDALLNSPPKQAFVIKTAIWFDVLASVTTQEDPHFLHSIRALFYPARSTIYDISTSIPQYSMMSPMGCENAVVWALAETSHLAAWKRRQMNEGCLSIPELVSRGKAIDLYLDPIPQDSSYQDEIGQARLLAAEIFRSSARLYLRSVVSGDFPHVQEIRDAVEETIKGIERINEFRGVARSVTRSTVFSIFICGALADDDESRSVILDQLNRETHESVGNCSSIRTLLTEVWKARANGRRSDPVRWRDLLKETSMLLV